MPTITFLGGTDTVTGSKFLFASGDASLLVDCGLFQGPGEMRRLNWEDPAFEAGLPDEVLLTHAHIDHSGYLPRLAGHYRFAGPVRATVGHGGPARGDAPRLRPSAGGNGGLRQQEGLQPASPRPAPVHRGGRPARPGPPGVGAVPRVVRRARGPGPSLGGRAHPGLGSRRGRGRRAPGGVLRRRGALGHPGAEEPRAAHRGRPAAHRVHLRGPPPRGEGRPGRHAGRRRGERWSGGRGSW